MNTVKCFQSKGKNCAECKCWTGKGGGMVVCNETVCRYKFSFLNWLKAVMR